SRHPRHLHSFPTRRSSDLVRAVARIRASVHVKLLAGFLLITLLFIAITAVSLRTVTETARQTNLLDQAHVRVGWSRLIEHALARSEEHTSELQSRFDLVCR